MKFIPPPLQRAFLSLFSGIGGFDYAAYKAGLRFDYHLFSEIEKYSINVFQKNFPGAIPLGDVTKIKYDELPKAKYIVCGGFPCQPHSMAGKRKGKDDERDLWFECRRMLRKLRPEIALFENVPGLFTSNGGRFFNRVISDISESGYDTEWCVISAENAGAPHKRERVWIVAYSKGKGVWRETRNIFEANGGSDGSLRVKSFGTSISPENMAHPDSTRLQTPRAEQQTTRISGCGKIPNSGNIGSIEWKRELRSDQQIAQTGENYRGGEAVDAFREWWAVEPNVGRVANGIPFRVDRLKCLGNAIVPQVAEMIFNLQVFDYWRIKP
jgi:DNA (cytosine-5)-methyltransferase 1